MASDRESTGKAHNEIHTKPCSVNQQSSQGETTMKALWTLTGRGFILALALMAYTITAGTVDAQTTDNAATIQHGANFVDEDGDGFNDNAPDHDGDGIPNGQDSDYARPQDGSGMKTGQGRGQGRANGTNEGKGYGKANGTGEGASVRQRLRDGSELGGAYGPGTGTAARPEIRHAAAETVKAEVTNIREREQAPGCHENH
jgi:hypothetical protein